MVRHTIKPNRHKLCCRYIDEKSPVLPLNMDVLEVGIAINYVKYKLTGQVRKFTRETTSWCDCGVESIRFCPPGLKFCYPPLNRRECVSVGTL